jgi:cell pole-organizing protein PopZ
MTDARAQQEPSMEEILSSIRRIISEDGQRAPGEPAGAPPLPPEAPAAPPPKPAAAAPAAADEDVLELTEMVPEETTARAVAPAPMMEEPAPITEEPAPLPEPPMAPLPEPIVEPEPQPEPEPEPVATIKPPAAEPAPATGGRLMSQETELASAAALSILGQLIDPDRRLNEEGRQMIEAAAREKIVPLLREWIDGNLAQLIQSLVREEIQRVMARAFGKEV